MISKVLVKSLIKTYKDAWEKRDPEKIIEIFTKNAVYYERLHEKPFKGHRGIKKYWKDKVVDEQENVKFRLKKIYIDGNNAVVEWEARFRDKKKKVNTYLNEIAVLEIKNGKIKSLREYWHAKHRGW